MKLFAETMGLYPPGTLVELTSGELAVVCAAPVVGRPLDRPKVRVVSGGERGPILDLDESVRGEFGECEERDSIRPTWARCQPSTPRSSTRWARNLTTGAATVAGCW